MRGGRGYRACQRTQRAGATGWGRAARRAVFYRPRRGSARQSRGAAGEPQVYLASTDGGRPQAPAETPAPVAYPARGEKATRVQSACWGNRACGKEGVEGRRGAPLGLPVDSGLVPPATGPGSGGPHCAMLYNRTPPDRSPRSRFTATPQKTSRRGASSHKARVRERVQPPAPPGDLSLGRALVAERVGDDRRVGERLHSGRRPVFKARDMEERDLELGPR